MCREDTREPLGQMMRLRPDESWEDAPADYIADQLEDYKKHALEAEHTISSQPSPTSPLSPDAPPLDEPPPYSPTDPESPPLRATL